MKTQTMLKILLLASLAAGLVACSTGSETAGSSEFASRSDGTAVNDTTKAWITCNAGTSTGGQFDMRIAAYKENNVIRNDMMLARISRVPSDFASSNEYFQLFRWQANTAGSLYTDPTPLAFDVWDMQKSVKILSAKTSLRWSDLSTAASSAGISDPTTFLKRLTFVVDVRDPTAQFDAMMMVIYNTSNTARDVGNILMPVFDANPELYATESNGQARHAELMKLHPFKDRIGQGWTTADFVSGANSLCSSF